MTQQPLVSLVLLAYNQEEYIREAVEAALAQTYEPLEIILSDDCSTDETFAIMKEMAAVYGGPHKIVLNRNPKNLGIAEHVNRVFELAKGELIVTAAGDDVSLPSRVEDTVDCWLKAEKRPDGLVFGSIDRVKGTRWTPPPAVRLSAETIIEQATASLRGASAAWSKRLFELWGPLPTGALCEDQPLAFRALLSGGILRDDRTVVVYRTSDGEPGLPRHTLLAGNLWRMKRHREFYKVYEADLESLMAKEPSRAGELKRLLSRLRSRREKLGAEITFLERSSRMDGLRYAVALLGGRTWTQGPLRARALRAVTVLRRLTVEGRKIQVLDENDHHGNHRSRNH